MFKILSHNLALATFMACLILTIPACKKSDRKSKTEYLTQGSWKQVKYEQRAGTTGAWVDLTGTPPSCELDNLLIFLITGTYEANEGATKCNSGDPQIIDAGTWSFLTNETQISITSTGSSPDVADVDWLDDNTLQVTSNYTFGTTTYYDRQTFSH